MPPVNETLCSTYLSKLVVCADELESEYSGLEL